MMQVKAEQNVKADEIWTQKRKKKTLILCLQDKGDKEEVSIRSSDPVW